MGGALLLYFIDVVSAAQGSIQCSTPDCKYVRTQMNRVMATLWPRVKRKRLPSCPTRLVAAVATLMDWGEIISVSYTHLTLPTTERV